MPRDVQVNLAYRWFCGLSIEDKIPDQFQKLVFGDGVRPGVEEALAQPFAMAEIMRRGLGQAGASRRSCGRVWASTIQRSARVPFRMLVLPHRCNR